ncbi:MAG: amino acid ABC transporter permease, partial [Lachnospiraceae bacterium]|nr:amino acid ABC transporter permease [Lachnospiraceae bacterium]
MDYEFIIKFLPLYKNAVILTLKIGIIGIIFAIIIGLALTIITFYQVPVLRNITKFYIELSRNTP